MNILWFLVCTEGAYLTTYEQWLQSKTYKKYLKRRHNITDSLLQYT